MCRFRCGSKYHKIKDCKEQGDICVPCKKAGLRFDHRGRSHCGMYQKHLELLKVPKVTSEDQRRPLKDRAQEAITPAELQQQKVVTPEAIRPLQAPTADPTNLHTPKPKKDIRLKVLLSEDDSQPQLPASV